MDVELDHVISAISTSAELGIFLYFYRDNREPFLYWWTLGWLCYTLWWVWLMLTAVTPGTPLWLSLWYLCGGLAALCSCASGLALRGEFTLRVSHGIGIGLYGALVVLGTSFPRIFEPCLLVVPLTEGLGYLVSAWLFLPRRQSQPMTGAKLLAGAQALRGLQWLCGPILFQSPQWGASYMAAAAFFHQLAVMGMIMLVLEHSKRRALALTSRLEQAERLATLGELSAGVAHEIRNPLGAIVNAVHAIGTTGEALSSTEKSTLVQVVKQEAARLNRLLTDFVQFAKPSEPQWVVGDVNALLAEVAALLRRDASTVAGISIREELAPNLPVTSFDTDQLRQAIWNIAKNGIESMEAGQELRISSEASNGEVLIHIQDAGKGIEAREAQHIFRPFYSRKAKGTGLGLSIAERIIQAHEGKIDVQSRSEAGTTFTIHLPLPKGVTHHGVHSRRG